MTRNEICDSVEPFWMANLSSESHLSGLESVTDKLTIELLAKEFVL